MSDRRYVHSAELIEQLRKLWEQGLTVGQIAKQVRHLNPNKIIGIARRNGFPAREPPIKRSAVR